MLSHLTLHRKWIPFSIPWIPFTHNILHYRVAIPDTIYYKEEDSRLYVYDSKYYTIKNVKKAADDKESGTVTGLSSNSDIIKQVAYLKGIKNSLKKVYREPEISRYIFLLPYYDKNYKTDDKTYDNGLFSRTGYVKPGNYDRLVEDNDQNGNDQLTDDDRPISV